MGNASRAPLDGGSGGSGARSARVISESSAESRQRTGRNVLSGFGRGEVGARVPECREAAGAVSDAELTWNTTAPHTESTRAAAMAIAAVIRRARGPIPKAAALDSLPNC